MWILIQITIFSALFLANRRYFSGRDLEITPHPTIPNFIERVGRNNKGFVVSKAVGIEQRGSFPFIVTRERFYHRFLKWIGIAKEVQSGDQKIDKALYFITDYPDHLSLALQSKEFRQNIYEIFQHSAKTLYSTKDKIWCELHRKHFKKDRMFFDEYGSRLKAIQSDVTKFPKEQETKGFKNRLVATAFMAVHSAALTFPLVASFSVIYDDIDIIHNRLWLELSFKAGIILILFWFILIVKFFTRTAWIPWVILDFIVFGIVGFILSSSYIVRNINTAMDSSPPLIVSQPFQSKSCRLKCRLFRSKSTIELTEDKCEKEKRADTLAYYQKKLTVCTQNSKFEYNLITPHWRSDYKEEYSIKVPSKIYDLADKGSLVNIPVYQGYLGIEWVDSKKIQLLVEK